MYLRNETKMLRRKDGMRNQELLKTLKGSLRRSLPVWNFRDLEWGGFIISVFISIASASNSLRWLSTHLIRYANWFEFNFWLFSEGPGHVKLSRSEHIISLEKLLWEFPHLLKRLLDMKVPRKLVLLCLTSQEPWRTLEEWKGPKKLEEF